MTNLATYETNRRHSKINLTYDQDPVETDWQG